LAQTPSQPVKAARRLPLRTENAKSGLSGRPAHPAAPVIGIAAARGMDTAENHRRDASCRQKSA